MIFIRHQHLTLALLLSLLLHLTMLVAPGWVLPSLVESVDAESGTPIEARLGNSGVRRTAQPIANTKPIHDRRPAVSPTFSVPESPVEFHQHESQLGIASGQPDVVSEASTSGPAAVEAAAQVVIATPESSLPRQGRIRFLVTRGDQGFVVGQSLHRWSHDGKTYTLSNTTETTGLAAFFKPVQVTQTSVGEISSAGLRPREFRTGKNGVPGDVASFDWVPMTLQLSAGNPREVALKLGAQDMLSMFYQLSARFPQAQQGLDEVMVATGRKFERYAFEVLREENLSTRQGDMRTLHLRTSVGIEAIDIWSALDLQGLPLKIRYTDRQGESFDQIADEIEFEGKQSMNGKP